MPNAVTAVAGQPVSCPSDQKKSDSVEFFKSAQFFGRMCVKVSCSLALSVFEIPSLATECVFGLVGAGVGALVGQVLISARKCMGAKARKTLGLENVKRLSEYVSDGFHKGARVGYLPGKVVGAAALLSVGALVCANAKVTLPILGTYVSVISMFFTAHYNADLRESGANAFDLSRHFLQPYRDSFRSAHNALYAVDDVDGLPV